MKVFDAKGNVLVTVSELDDIADVNIPAPAESDLIKYDNATSKFIALAVAASRIIGRKATGAIAALAKADILTIINVADGADVTGSNAPQAHKDLHDPIDGSDKLDSAAPVKVGSANAIGSSHSFARADHVHEREHVKYTNAEAVDAIKADDNLPLASITFIIDGGGSAITTGVKGALEIPFACTINRVTLLADQSGSIVIDIWKQAYADYPPEDAQSITASAPPTLSSAVMSQDSTLTGWTTAIAAGDCLKFNVDSIATCTWVVLSLKVTKT